MIDQQNTASHYFGYGVGASVQSKHVAQTFTAGVDGSLVGIAMQLGSAGTNPASGSLSVRIVNTYPGPASHGTGWFQTDLPGYPGEPYYNPSASQVLASFTIDVADLPIVQFQFGHVAPMSDMFALPTPIDIEAGEQYAILLEYTGPGYLAWHYKYQWPDANTYDGGRSFYRVGAGYGWTSPEYDLAFQTFVDGVQQVPEPGTLALLAGGLIALGVTARRRRA